MDIIFMNSKNSETSDSQRVLINLTDKINLKRIFEYGALSNLSINYTSKDIIILIRIETFNKNIRK